MSPVNEHKILLEWQRLLEKPGFGVRSQSSYGSLIFVGGAMLLCLSIMWAGERAINQFALQCAGHLGGFFCGIGAIIWMGSRQFRVVAPHVSIESIERRIEELEV